MTTVIAAVLAFFGARAGTRQKERADSRAEWQKLFAIALGELSDGADARRRMIGRAILEDLVRRDLTTERQRELAETVLKRELEAGLAATPNTAGTGSLDDPATGWDNEDDTDGGTR